jgi:hypothetical protein
MDANFCRDTHCRIREIMDKPEQAGYASEKKKQETLSQDVCKNCKAWQYDNYLKQSKLKFKCKVSTMGCGDLCCTFCPGASECGSACKNKPSECGRSIVMK